MFNFPESIKCKDEMLSQLNAIHTLTAYLQKTQFITIVPSTFRCSKWPIYAFYTVSVQRQQLRISTLIVYNFR